MNTSTKKDLYDSLLLSCGVAGMTMSHRLYSDRNIKRCLFHGGFAFILSSVMNMILLRNENSQRDMATQFRNKAGVLVAYGTGASGRNKLYCGRFFGTESLPNSNGFCGPNNGPQCSDCEEIHST